MTDLQKQKKKEIKSENTVNPIVAGIAGAIAGGVAVAAAVAISDKKNQKKVKDAYFGAKGKVTDYIDKIKPQPTIDKSAKKLEKVVNDTKQQIKDKV